MTCVAAAAAITSFTYAVSPLRSPLTAAEPALPAWAANGSPSVISMVPARLLDTRSDGATIDGAFEGGGVVKAGQEVALQVIYRDAYNSIGNPVQRPSGPDGAPLTADDSPMVLLNVTAVYPEGPGFLTVYPCGAPLPTTSNVNYQAGAVVANSVLAPVGVDGKVCVYSHATTHLVVDVVGHVPRASSGNGGVVPVVPARLLETRNGPANTTADGLFRGQGRVAGGSEVRLQVIDRGAYTTLGGSAALPVGPDGVARTADDSVMVALNVTVVAPDAPGFVTVYPCGGDRPVASNVNYGSGDVVANSVLSQVGVNGEVCLFTHATTDLVVDVTGHVPAPALATTPGIIPVTPARLLETRPFNDTIDGAFELGTRVPANGEVQLQVVDRGGLVSGIPGVGVRPDGPGGAKLEPVAAMLNVTAVSPSAPGFVTVYPCGSERPVASNVNYGPGDVVANSVVSQIASDGTVCLYSLAATDLVVDVTGYVVEGVHRGVDLTSRSADDQVISSYYDGSSGRRPPALGGAGADDGRYIAFESSEGGIDPQVDGTVNGVTQIYWRDRRTGETVLISKTADGVPGSAVSLNPSISQDGLTVVFDSFASNLPGATPRQGVFVWNRFTGLTSLTAAANAASSEPSISGDGEWVAYASYSDNLAPGVTGTTSNNVYRMRLDTGVTELISRKPGGQAASGSSPSLSHDGTRLAFYSFSADIVSPDINPVLWDIFLWEAGTFTQLTKGQGGTPRQQGDESASRIVAPTISGDGRHVAFATTSGNVVNGDTNGMQDVFVVNVATLAVTMASTGVGGLESNGDSPISQGGKIALSYDGSTVAFNTAATNLSFDVLWKHLPSGAVFALPPTASRGAGAPTISASGTKLAYGSSVEGLDIRFPDTNGVYVFDRGS